MLTFPLFTTATAATSMTHFQFGTVRESENETHSVFSTSQLKWEQRIFHCILLLLLYLANRVAVLVRYTLMFAVCTVGNSIRSQFGVEINKQTQNKMHCIVWGDCFGFAVLTKCCHSIVFFFRLQVSSAFLSNSVLHFVFLFLFT